MNLTGQLHSACSDLLRGLTQASEIWGNGKIIYSHPKSGFTALTTTYMKDKEMVANTQDRKTLVVFPTNVRNRSSGGLPMLGKLQQKYQSEVSLGDTATNAKAVNLRIKRRKSTFPS